MLWFFVTLFLHVGVVGEGDGVAAEVTASSAAPPSEESSEESAEESAATNHGVAARLALFNRSPAPVANLAQVDNADAKPFFQHEKRH